MNISLSTEQQDLRRRARAWFESERLDPFPLSLDERFAHARAWQRRLYDAGWIGLGWPQEYGGQGGSPVDQIILNQEMARARVPPPVGLVGLEVVGPTILHFGTEEQKRCYLPPLLRGDEIWCQCFSEPEAGSDLGALRTAGMIDGDMIVVSGRKVWTSWAQFADRCAVLVRTDPEANKGQGITYLLADMKTPGIDVQPLVQMTGDAEFSEVLFDDVRVPVANVLGELNQGWQIAMTTLASERGPFALRRQAELRAALDDLVSQLHGVERLGTRVLDDPLARESLGECEVLVEVLGAHGYETVTRIAAGDFGAESSIDKLLLTEAEQYLHGVALDLLGPERTIVGSDGMLDRGRWIREYLYSRAASIYGGSSEIQRNLVASRLLGLPPEPR